MPILFLNFYFWKKSCMKNIATITLFAVSQVIFAQSTFSPPPPPAVEREAELSVSFTKIYDSPEKVAEFPGGLAAFEGTIKSNVDIADFQTEHGENTFKSIVSFTVERDGSITGIKATGVNEDFNKEIYRAARSIRNKWKPGQYKGENVRSRVQIPLMMNFE